MDFLRAVRRAYYEKGAPLYGRGYWSATDIDIVDWKTGKGNLAHGLDFIATGFELRWTGRRARSRCSARSTETTRAAHQPCHARGTGKRRKRPHDGTRPPGRVAL